MYQTGELEWTLIQITYSLQFRLCSANLTVLNRVTISMFKLETIKKVILTTICWLHIKQLTSCVPILNIFHKALIIYEMWYTYMETNTWLNCSCFEMSNNTIWNNIRKWHLNIQGNLCQERQLLPFYIFAVRIWTI
jgi:hypothetical protein